MAKITSKQQIQLVQRVMRNSFYFSTTKTGYTQGISKLQLATLLGVSASAVNNWLKSNNSINIKNLTFLLKLDKISSSASNGNPIQHTVSKKQVIRKIRLHGISKYDGLKYKFLTMGQKYWTDAHAVTV